MPADSLCCRNCGLEDAEADGRYPLTDAGFGDFAAGCCSKLTTLDVRGCGMTDAKLVAIASGFPQLRELNIVQPLTTRVLAQTSTAASGAHGGYDIDCGPFDFFDAVTDAGITALALGCHDLVSLTLDSGAVSDAGVAALAAHCPRLVELNISCDKVTDAALRSLQGQLPELRVAPACDEHYGGDVLM